MLEGLYSAAAGLIAQQQRLDAVANDVSNVNTTGYKRVRVSFRDLAYQETGRGANNGVTTGSGAAVSTLGRSFQQGALRQTERPLDLAIEGQGFFRVRTPEGAEALTRDGNFHVDDAGQLVNAQGLRLVPPITVPRGTNEDDISISQNGVVTANGRRVGQIQLVDVPAPDGLQSAGDNLFLPTAASGAARNVGNGDARIVQGALEASNVDIADAMVDMMTAQRAFGLAQRAIQMQDQAMEIANGIKR
jgi:flagellar basal-body rod protein FlgG